MRKHSPETPMSAKAHRDIFEEYIQKARNFQVLLTNTQIKSPEFRIPEIHRFIERIGVRWSKGHRTNHYDQYDDTISIKRDNLYRRKDDYYSLVFHELGHWTGNRYRLKRRHSNWDTKAYRKEEIIAEMVAIMLCIHFKIKPYRFSDSYIACQIRNSSMTERELEWCLKKSSEAAEYLLRFSGDPAFRKSEQRRLPTHINLKEPKVEPLPETKPEWLEVVRLKEMDQSAGIRKKLVQVCAYKPYREHWPDSDQKISGMTEIHLMRGIEFDYIRRQFEQSTIYPTLIINQADQNIDHRWAIYKSDYYKHIISLPEWIVENRPYHSGFTLLMETSQGTLKRACHMQSTEQKVNQIKEEAKETLEDIKKFFINPNADDLEALAKIDTKSPTAVISEVTRLMTELKKKEEQNTNP